MLTGVTLTVMCGPQAGTKFHIPVPSSCTIGRSSECDIAIIGHPDPTLVSRFHCGLEVSTKLVTICDLGSFDGTFLNDRPIGPSALDRHHFRGLTYPSVNNGDIISFGGVELLATLHVEEPISLQTTGASHSNRYCPTGALSW